MKKYLLPPEGKDYKANLHCHSTWSDGACTPEKLKELYKGKGYSVLAITDHEGLFRHPELDDEEFLTIAGCELEFNEENGPDYDSWIVAHLCVYSPDSSARPVQVGFDPAYDHPKFTWLHDPQMRSQHRHDAEAFSKEYSAANINHVIRRLRETGHIVTYNHPKWSQEDYSRYAEYEGMSNLEVYNHSCYTAGYDESNGEVYDVLLRRGQRIFCVAADDNHSAPDRVHPDMFGGFTMIRADGLEYESVFAALKKGDFYASTGPQIDQLYIEDGRLCVTTREPVRRIRMLTGNRHAGCVFNDDGSPVTGGEFWMHADDIYVRLEIIGMDGSTAWTNACFLDTLDGMEFAY